MKCASVALACAAFASCASTTTAPRAAVVVRDGERELFAGGAAWTVRATSTGREDVVRLEGVGEVIVTADGCRLVRADASGALLVEEAPACAEERGERLCFTSASFGAVRVSGCAERNEIFLERLTDQQLASVGPTSFIERCAPIPHGAARYVRVVDIDVDGNDRPRHGLRLRYRDGFEVCFLARTRGAYHVLVDLEDPQPRRVTLSGAVDEL